MKSCCSEAVLEGLLLSSIIKGRNALCMWPGGIVVLGQCSAFLRQLLELILKFLIVYV